MTTRPERADTDDPNHFICRHSAVVRMTHWINALCLLILLMSGLQIFNAHPALNFGNRSDPAAEVLAIGATSADDGTVVGLTQLGNLTFRTTGFLGASTNSAGEVEDRAFPSWLTLPGYRDLATGRRWHFFFAWLFVINGLVYLAHSLATGHVRRDLVPTREQLKRIGHDISEHLRLRFPKGEDAKHYNVLQKLAYAGTVFVVLPMTILAGLTMSPALDAAFPFLLDVFGGRQSARTIHFIGANLIVVFVVVHVVMVLLSGFFNNMKSMITGRYRIEPAEATDEG